MTRPLPDRPHGYPELLAGLKTRIRQARVKAALAVNSELVLLYWNIGRDILSRQEREGWGAKVLDRLSADLRMSFPGRRGLSVRNLKYMRDLAREWPDGSIGQQLVAQLPWGHNLSILRRLKSSSERCWYMRACIDNGWSRNVLEMQIESQLYHRRGTITNFERTLPEPQSDLARELLKDPYNFEFLHLSDDASELAIERGLLDQVRRFLLELGQGFAFLGSQVPLDVGNDRFYLDLLFYHVRLHCYIVIELKAGSFTPEHAGKLNFYLSAVDETMRSKNDSPSIGLILCRRRNRFVVEYSLRDMGKPLGVSQYGLTSSLPEELRDSLPSVEVLEHGLRETRSEGR